MGMDELSVMMDLSGEVRVTLVRGLEHHLGAVGELVRRQVDLAKRPLSDEPTERVVADILEVLVGEFAVWRLCQCSVRIYTACSKHRAGD